MTEENNNLDNTDVAEPVAEPVLDENAEVVEAAARELDTIMSDIVLPDLPGGKARTPEEEKQAKLDIAIQRLTAMLSRSDNAPRPRRVPKAVDKKKRKKANKLAKKQRKANR